MAKEIFSTSGKRVLVEDNERVSFLTKAEHTRSGGGGSRAISFHRLPRRGFTHSPR